MHDMYAVVAYPIELGCDEILVVLAVLPPRKRHMVCDMHYGTQFDVQHGLQYGTWYGIWYDIWHSMRQDVMQHTYHMAQFFSM